MNKPPELLAPAGSEECLRAAVENGADAVYFGLAGPRGFNARVRAKSIPIETLGETMVWLHRRGVRGYVTLNTLVRADELPEIERLLRTIAEARVDAILVQDFGVARLARRFCPDLPLHASTQMSLTSQHGIELAATLGIDRVVLPRELSLEQIAELRRSTDIELECFVHGALCMSFSGQCYASLGLGGRGNDRTANRGRCAQPCRLSYTLLDAETDEPVAPPRQLFSPNDLASLPVLPKLIATGVHALKIEGRLKPPEYVAEVTRIYRSAIDRIAAGDDFEWRDDLERLELTFSRGFFTGWLEGANPRRLVPGNITDHRGSLLGTVVEMRRDAAVVRLSAPVRRGDGVLFENEEQPEKSQGGRVYEIIQRRESVKEAGAGAKVLLTFANDSINAEFVKQGQMVRKTDDPRLQREIRKGLENVRPKRRIPLDITVRAAVGEPIRLEVRSETGVECRLEGERPLEEARKHPLSAETLREQFDRLGETEYCLGQLDAEIEGSPMVPLSVLGKLRRDMVERLDSFQPKPTPVRFGDSLETLREENRSTWNEPATETSSPLQPTLHLLLRDIRHFDEAALRRTMDAGCLSFYAELRRLGEYRLAVETVRQIGAEFVIALPRILKPGDSAILESLAELEPDAVLARNLGEVEFFRRIGVPVLADFSLNAVNDLSVRQLLDWGVRRITPGWDIDAEQLAELVEAVPMTVPVERLEIVAVGRIPLFTMEHCLWRANLVDIDRPCDRLCERRSLKVRDRRGAIHSVRCDLFCRNIVEQSELLEFRPLSGCRHFRIEWDTRLGDASPEETIRAVMRKLT